MAKPQPQVHTHAHPRRARQLLLEGEQPVISVRTHIKALFGPFALSLLLIAAGVFAVLQVTTSTPRLIIGGIALVAVLLVLLPPWLRWIFWTYTLTNIRLIEQRGVFKRTGRVIPLSRINNVSFEKDFSDRLLRCGTLVVHDASEKEGLKLDDIPHIALFHRTISTLVLKAHGQEVGPSKETETER
ncbi:MAG: PH domain-containing protein [Micrococcales bacterium]|nr:PH domain-containing protein [Micrococcales bacterium]